MKLKKLLFILIPLVLAISLALYLFLINRPASPKGTTLIIEVSDSTTPSQLTQLLKRRGLIRSPRLLRTLLFLKKPKVGLYQINPSMTSFQITQKINRGQTDAFKVTFPEGFRAAQMALRLERIAQVSTEEFLKAAQNEEGYLFPDTYYFALTITPQEIVKALKENFEAKTQDLNLSQEDVILASIVEREAKTYEERQQIATLYLSRLKLGMKLEADPTIRYGLDSIGVEKGDFKNPDFEFWKPLKISEIRIPYPYNTYLLEGFPPGPISNPGILSLKAVKNPIQNFPYLYFFHDKEGKIEFSKNFSEHQTKLEASRK